MRLLLACLLLSGCDACGPPHMTAQEQAAAMGFASAKRELRRLYDNGETIYAGCAFAGWRVDWSACCYDPPEGPRRRLEWEHVVPAKAFGDSLPAWKRGHPACKGRGRKCARRVDEAFRLMEGDMHNLFPAIGVINERRGHKAMGVIDGEQRPFGRCDVEIARVIEPRPDVRGDVARAYLYMAKQYASVALDDAGKAMFERWHIADPPSDMEKLRNDFIERTQGNRNPFIDR